MPHTVWCMTVIVLKFGVHYRWAHPALLDEQLRLAHSLREDLVTQQLDYEAAVKAVWSSYPAVATTETELAAADSAALEAASALAKARSEQGTKRVLGPVPEELADTRRRAKAARIARREAIAAVREDALPRLSALAEDLRAAQKALYADYCQQRGLYWATFNDVVDHNRTAVKRVAADRKAGKPATLRHHRFDGSGTIAVQLQRPSGVPPRTPARIADDLAGKWRNVFTMPFVAEAEWQAMPRAQQRKAGRMVARMRCGTGWVEIPVQAHRMFPDDADITGARLTVQRVAGSYRAHLTVTAKVPDPHPVTDGPSVALHLGWRTDGDHVTVGTWRSSAALDVPADLRHVFTTSPGGLTGTVRLPQRLFDRLAALDTIRSERDLALGAVRTSLVDWLKVVGPQAHPRRDEQMSAHDVAHWRSPARFAALATAWRNLPPTAPGGPQMAALLEAWRQNDRASWERQEHGRAKASGYRTDLYRQVAALIAQTAAVVVVDDMSVRDIASLKSDLPNEVEQRIAHRRTVAAPGTLREAVTTACAREGVGVLTVAAAGLSRIHAGCGHENPADGRYAARPVRCDGCGVDYDPDLSATVLMLARAVTPTTPNAGSTRIA